jgi:phosphate transport system permease protein
MAVAAVAAPGVERLAFGGDVKAWLGSALGLVYDQRNSIVVGIAMGFAVIPIIFTIAEDSFSAVPAHLTAASLALGASRWQTATRVVLPTASPGVFSAIMVGFGRAVGETMIVLMATGNTPVMDWSPFNGMRTLSANIAVEIAEAPHGGTLYRVLFLAAGLLFLLTFLVNTVAEVVRQRLRERYRAL